MICCNCSQENTCDRVLLSNATLLKNYSFMNVSSMCCKFFESSYFSKFPRWPVSVLDDYIIPHRWNHGKHSWSSNLDISHQAYSFREERELSFIDQFHGRLLHLKNSKILKILFLFTNQWYAVFFLRVHLYQQYTLLPLML